MGPFQIPVLCASAAFVNCLLFSSTFGPKTTDGQITAKHFSPASRRRTADMYGLHRNLLSDSFLFNNQFRDSVGESEERTLLTHMNGRVNLDQGAAEEAVSLGITQTTAQWILGLAWPVAESRARCDCALTRA